MTETQKEIIEIIEPFMDKTLSEGCIIKYPISNVFGKILLINKNNIGLITNSGIIEISRNINFKILGHYDMTAVEKYILNNTGKIDTTIDMDFKWFNIGKFKLSEANICIPNKPLHLYTEKENKNLLELLKRLGT